MRVPDCKGWEGTRAWDTKASTQVPRFLIPKTHAHQRWSDGVGMKNARAQADRAR